MFVCLLTKTPTFDAAKLMETSPGVLKTILWCDLNFAWLLLALIMTMNSFTQPISMIIESITTLAIQILQPFQGIYCLKKRLGKPEHKPSQFRPHYLSMYYLFQGLGVLSNVKKLAAYQIQPGVLCPKHFPMHWFDLGFIQSSDSVASSRSTKGRSEGSSWFIKS